MGRGDRGLREFKGELRKEKVCASKRVGTHGSCVRGAEASLLGSAELRAKSRGCSPSKGEIVKSPRKFRGLFYLRRF